MQAIGRNVGSTNYPKLKFSISLHAFLLKIIHYDLWFIVYRYVPFGGCLVGEVGKITIIGFMNEQKLLWKEEGVEDNVSFQHGDLSRLLL